MTREQIIAMAREADCLDESHYGSLWADKLIVFAALVAAAEREILANWMRQHGFSTGQAYTTDSLLDRLGTEMVENVDAAVLAEREACAKVCEDTDIVEFQHCMVLHEDAAKTLSNAAVAIRARGDTNGRG